jgi:hypothetical protein
MQKPDSNPFIVQTPEGISAEEAVYLFVDVFSEYFNIPAVGHTFIHGARGSGKSMMFRYMEPDCQVTATGKAFSDLPFFGAYVPVKNHELKLTELERLDRHAALVLNEHFLSVFVASKVFASFRRVPGEALDSADLGELSGFYTGTFARLITRAGWREELPALESSATAGAIISAIAAVLDDVYVAAIRYFRTLAVPNAGNVYDGALCGYLDFLLPLLRALRQLRFMPRGPIYLLIDDADNLNEVQTTILNSWVSARTTTDVSIKVSTQLNYKTFRTAGGQMIDSPHDYVGIDLTSVFTAVSSGKYHDRVKEITTKRLRRFEIAVPPEEFFPPYEKQEKEIEAIEREYIERWEQTGRGHRPRDDAYRYARPEYIRRLGGNRKSTSKYRYAGFSQLVHLSSGVIRYFLEGAFEMYNSARSSHPGLPVLEIDSDIQDDVVRRQANEFILAGFDRLIREHEGAHDARMLDLTIKLRNLVSALGGTFEQILTSDASERRVFSVALSDAIEKDVLDVFRLGISYGYFHESSIGNKEGTGRTRMFVLSKRLAPAFNLDPSGFSGYKFVTCAALREAIDNPKAVLRRVRGWGTEQLDALQLELF